MYPLPEKYPQILRRIEKLGGTLIGLTVTDGPLLRDLARQAFRLSREEPRPIERITNLVRCALASTYTFRGKELECGEDFPSGLPIIEQERWFVGMRCIEPNPTGDTPIQALEEIAPGRYPTSTLRDLETQIGARIGDCAVYSTTLGILIACTSLCSQVRLFGKPPHAWVALTREVWKHSRSENSVCRSITHRIDLAQESHGRLADDYQTSLAEAEAVAPFVYDLTVT